MAFAVLSEDEVAAVSGGFGIPGAVLGGVGSGIGYWYDNPSANLPGLVTSIGTGALGGALGGVAGWGIGLSGGLYGNEVGSWY
ncbi:MAG TPA: hypothetical protein VIM12_17930 [Noviherbaspirillum sp.]|uniref:hypothetical protein n=1 Tax=Noviherbaspirillum sp. TaxID=1926288 RepID=UPI002F958335